MTTMNKEVIDKNIELYFYNPNKEKDEFIDDYKKLEKERYRKEKSYRYSPMFYILKDIRYCLGSRKQLNYIPKKEKDPASFAGIILIRIAFINLVKKFYNGDYPGFAKRFMGISDAGEIRALGFLRDGLEHNNYTLSFHVNGKKYFFLVGNGLTKLIEKVSLKGQPSAIGYRIDITRLRASFEMGVVKFKEYLLDHNNVKARKRFCKKFDVDNWIFIKKDNKNK